MAKDGRLDNGDMARALLNASKEAACLIDTEGIFLEINEEMAKRFGRKAEEIIGTNAFDYTPPEIAKARRERIRQVVETQQPIRFVDQRGDRILDSNIHPIFNEAGEVDRLALFSQDITEQKQAEDKLAESELKYRSFVENSPAGVFFYRMKNPMPLFLPFAERLSWIKDNLYLFDCNDALAHAWNMPDADSIRGMTLYEILQSDAHSLEAVIQIYDRCDYRVKGEEILVESRAGNRRYFIDNSSCEIAEGHLYSIQGTSLNITERKFYEQQIRFQSQIMEQINDSVIAVDMEGIITNWNRASEDLFKYPANEATGKHVRLVYPEESYDYLDNEIIPRLLSEGRTEIETTLVRKDGNRFDALVTLSILSDEAGITNGMIGYTIDITARKQAEQLIKESESKFRGFVENNQAGVFFYNFRKPMPLSLTLEEKVEWVKEHVYLEHCNDALSKAYGRKDAEEIKGLSLFDILDKDNRALAGLVRIYEESGHVLKNQEIALQDESGTWVYLMENATAEIIDDCIHSIQGTSLNITEQKRIQEQVRFQSQIMEQINDSVIAVDMEGIITSWNQASQKLFNYATEEAIGQHVSLVYPEESYKTLNEEIIPGLLKEKRMEIETILVKKDGRQFDGLVSLSVLTDEYGETNGMIGYTIDISARKRAERLLAESESRYRSLVQTAPVVILNLTLEGEIVDFNPVAETVLGVSLFEVIGRNFIDIFIPEEEQEKIRGKMIQAGKGDPVAGVESGLNSRDDEGRYYSWSMDHLLREGNQPDGLVCIGIDITPRRKALDALKEANATKDKFFSLLGHDLKGPIGGARDLFAMLGEQYESMSVEDVKRYITTGAGTLGHTFELLEDLLTWSRSQRDVIELKPEVFDLEEYLEINTSLYRQLADKKKIIIRKELTANVRIKADRKTSNTVLRNLLSNALKFTRQEGTITLRGGIVSVDGNCYVEISVEDNGVGISEDRIGQLFRVEADISTRGTDNERGTGFGLVLCKEFVEKNGGRIEVKSEEGKGSAFSFTLPCPD